MTSKKARERLALTEIAKIYPDFPSGTIVACERPDFLILQDRQTVGIEIVNYIRGQSDEGSDIRRNEILWKKVSDETRTRFSETHSEPLVVNFFWYPQRLLSKSEIEQLADSAASIVADNIPEALFAQIRVDGIQLAGTPLEKYVCAIVIMRVRNEQQSLWSSPSAGWIELLPEELEDLILSKDAKVNEYLQRCSRVWLVIVADGQHISSTAELPGEIRQHQIQSQFERILFYDRLNHRVFALASD
ncbi:MAG: hypothetical protein PVH17_02645 [Anaerolineae bacterium]|jgi:hypothetical protein